MDLIITAMFVSFSAPPLRFLSGNAGAGVDVITSGTSAVFRTISFSVQRFSFDNGRDSSILTTSPGCASFFSSCA